MWRMDEVSARVPSRLTAVRVHSRPPRRDTSRVANSDSSLALAADIERRDADLAAAIDLIARLSRRADDVRVRSEELQLFLDTVPGELARLDRSEAEARDGAATAAAGLAAAEQRVETLAAGRRGADSVHEAERELEQARRAATDASARHRHVMSERAALVETDAVARSEIRELGRRAGEIAHRIEYVPRVSQTGREAPGAGLAELADWGRSVHAALFVVRGQLEAERDRLVREANELAGAVLGEQLAGSSVTLVRRRLEEALRR